MKLKEEIKSYGKSIGVDLIGFTSAEPFEDMRNILEKRKKRNHLSGFEEQNIELRIHPKKTMADAKSIIVIGVSYYKRHIKQGEMNKPPFSGVLARTAWGRDYHYVLKEKLEKIAAFIQERIDDFRYKIFVDTGPLVDRHVAYRAGLGWYGYNALLINEKYGSWFFIGYMMNNVAFEEDKPLENKACEGCNLCIKNCPKGALEGPYEFNAKKCLSNLLQQKEEIYEEDRGILGKNLYGCDICQDVCPHNNKATEMSEDHFSPQAVSSAPDLIELLHMSNKAFKKTYGSTSAGWRGKKVLQRNAIIAIVNHGDKKALPYLIPLLKDNRPEIRSCSIWGIFQLDPFLAREISEEMKKKEEDQKVLDTIVSCLNKAFPFEN
ncbi:tRNA epoxyqueuosine(34) reductase QueG [Clostridium formicaceticum]|uniref:Epoxyqueuosine reductase n=1 Tax=Clostridium formicaceticum TaxID=1497 RepID=A0AAC9RGU9_9CLOT|nr:tRNA epoxyqueuosine(34) reductase QueG [Clostridium formicaceticum]AOY76331.1 tRNA epoxyqueuosine(34) reductase QueG [Clostridium formicaceticum]ARE86721.1 Epoxyqueuosine reductase [Clostridium formicaceticum]